LSEPAWRAELSDGQLRGELDRVYPERVRLRPRDLAGTREAMDLVDEMWAPTLARAQRLPREKLHERVDGEYSFVETLRHLLFAGDAWLQRMVLRVPDPFHEWGVPPDLPADAPPDTGPALEEVVPLREARAARVRAHLATLSEDDLRVRVGGPWDPPDLPPERRARVIDCFRVVFREEWWHHQFARRDLALIERD
jgi:DinB superfamily